MSQKGITFESLGYNHASLIILFVENIALQVTPKVTSVVIGDSTTITCTKAPNEGYPVDWRHRPAGSKDIIHIYSKVVTGFKEEYRADFSVDIQNSSGKYFLIMRNVKPEYAGTYFCVDNDPYATTDSAEVIVIGKPT